MGFIYAHVSRDLARHNALQKIQREISITHEE